MKPFPGIIPATEEQRRLQSVQAGPVRTTTNTDTTMTKAFPKRPYRAKAAVYTKPYTFNMLRLRPHNPGDTVTVEISRDSVTVRPSGASKTVSADSVVGHFKDMQDRVAVQGPVSQVKHVLNVASRLLQTQGVTPLLRDGVDALRSEDAAQDNQGQQ